MSHRPHAYALVKVPTHAGNPPNTYVPEITAEVRLYWTPTTDRELLLAALDNAVLRIKEKIDAQPESYDQAVLEVGVDIDSVGIPIRRRLAEEAEAAEAAPSTDEGWVRAQKRLGETDEREMWGDCETERRGGGEQ